MKKRVAVIGASGRTGGALVKILEIHPHFVLGAALVSSNSKLLNTKVSEGSSVNYSDDLNEILKCDGVIDFSTHQITLQVLEIAKSKKLPCVIASTGHTTEEIAGISAFSRDIALTRAPNTSLGVALLTELSKISKEILGSEFKSEILDIHHARKKDAPSGTAKQIANSIGGDVSISSMRGGDVVGEHTVFFLGPGERIEITHKAENRDLFAYGVCKLLSSLMFKEAGEYNTGALLIP